MQGAFFRATACTAASVSDAEKWTHAMARLGPRITGGEAHRKWITYLADGLSGMHVPVTRYPVPIRYWEATAWSLEVSDRLGKVTPIPVANYVPYAGETSRQGLSAQLVDLGAGAAEAYTGKDVTDKIVLVDKTFPADRSVRDYIGRLITTYPPDLDVGSLSLVGRPASGGGNNISALLATAKAQGASGAIVVLDLPPEAVIGRGGSPWAGRPQRVDVHGGRPPRRDRGRELIHDRGPSRHDLRQLLLQGLHGEARGDGGVTRVRGGVEHGLLHRHRPQQADGGDHEGDHDLEQREAAARARERPRPRAGSAARGASRVGRCHGRGGRRTAPTSILIDGTRVIL